MSSLPPSKNHTVQPGPGVPVPLRFYMALVFVAGGAWLAYLVQRAVWEPSDTWATILFALLIGVAGTFPLPVGPKVKAALTTAPLFGAALVLEPGAAAMAAVAGTLIYHLALRVRPQGLELPWWKYPFNLGETALSTGSGSFLFHTLYSGDTAITVAVLPTAAVMYLVNTSLVSGAAALFLAQNPVRIWWMGTRANGLAELSLFAFGFVGAVAYSQAPWTVLGLLTPVAIIYLAFSQLAKANARLEEALSTLEAMQGRLVSTSKLASVGALSLDLAHQIKNPLFVLMGRLEGLETALHDESRARRQLQMARRAASHLNELTEGFLDMGRQRWLSVDIAAMLDESISIATLRHTQRVNIERGYSEGVPQVQGNPVLLREAFSNLVSNAVDAVDEEGHVGVNASIDDGFVTVRISDNGQGISAEDKGHLFQPFHTTKTEGVGLGLFTAKHIIEEMHKGSLEIKSSPGEGTTAIIRLPATLPPVQDTDTQAPERSRSIVGSEDPVPLSSVEMPHTT